MVDFRQLIEDFNEKSGRLEGLLNGMLSTLEGRRSPSEEDAQSLRSAMDELRRSYADVREAASQVAAEVPDGESVDIYLGVLESHEGQLLERLAKLREVFDRFTRITSNEEGYRMALEEDRVEAEAILASLDSPAKSVEEKLEVDYGRQRALIEAIEIDDLGTPEGERLSDAIDELYSRKVCRGVYLRKYFIGDEVSGHGMEVSSPSDAAPATPAEAMADSKVDATPPHATEEFAIDGHGEPDSASRPSDGPGASDAIAVEAPNLDERDATPANAIEAERSGDSQATVAAAPRQTVEEVAGTDTAGTEETPEDVPEVLTSINPIRTNLKVNVKSFRNDLMRGHLGTARVLLPILSTFGALALDGVRSVLAMVLQDPTEENLDYTSTALGQLERKSIVSSFALGDDITVYALTRYGRTLLDRHSIRVLKLPTGKDYWAWPIPDHEFTADASVERASIEALLGQNDHVISLMTALFEHGGSAALSPFVRALRRVDGTYVVPLSWNDETYECRLETDPTKDRSTDDPVLLVAKEGERPEIPEDRTGDIFLLDGTKLLKWEHGWIEEEGETVEDEVQEDEVAEDGDAEATIAKSVEDEGEGEGPNSDDATSEAVAEVSVESAIPSTIATDSVPESESGNEVAPVTEAQPSDEAAPEPESEPELTPEDAVEVEASFAVETSVETISEPEPEGPTACQSSEEVPPESEAEPEPTSEAEARAALLAALQSSGEVPPERTRVEPEDEPTVELEAEAESPDQRPLREQFRDFVARKEKPSDADFVAMVDELLDIGGFSLSPEDELSDLAAALALAAAASTIEGYDESRALCIQLALATDTRVVPIEYTGEFINQAFPEYREGNKTLAFATYCRALFCPARAYDQFLTKTVTTLQNSFDYIFPDLAFCKPLFSTLMRVENVHRGGFTEAVVSMMGSESERREQLKSLSANAAQLRDRPKIKTMMHGLPELVKICFGEDSRLCACMDIIAKDDRAKADTVKRTLSHYGYGIDTPCTTATPAIDEEIDRVWEEATAKLSTQGVPLQYNARKKVKNEFLARLELMRTWLNHANESFDQDILNRLRSLRRSILDAIDAIERHPDLETVQDGLVIRWLLKTLRARLEDEPLDRPLFTSLLQSPYLSLDDGMLPVIEASFNTVVYYEPWRNVLRHLSHPLYSLEEVRELVFQPDSDFFDNYAQLRHVNAIIGDGDPDYEVEDAACAQAEKTAEDRELHFKDDLEIFYAYAQIDENQKEDLLYLLESFQDTITSQGDFGHLKQFIEALRHQVDDYAQSQGQWLRDQLDIYIEKSKRDLHSERPCQLLEEAERLLVEESNFAVVEDYLNRYEAGERTLADDTSLKDRLSTFFSDEVYGPIYEYCVQRMEQDFDVIARKYVNEHPPEGWGESQLNSAKELLLRWPGFSRKNTRRDYVKLIPQFLEKIGIKARGDAEPVNAPGRGMIFKVDVDPEPHDLPDYPHPIAEYGTRAKSPLVVLLLPDQFSAAEEIVDVVRSRSHVGIDVVLLDHPVSRQTRRDIAQLVHTSNANLNMFLLVDHVLALYLALHERSQRLPLMLKCTLPFTHYQPFVRGIGSVDDEMFCGRVRELNAIKDPKGASLVYGGRQLGKTALLERARSSCDDHAKGEYAVYVNIDDCDTESKACQGIVKAIREAKMEVADAATMEGLRDAIAAMMERTKGLRRFLLLIDEADDFLLSISSSKYEALLPLTTLMRSTGGQFKFVLAGLHNVARFKSATREENIIFGQLGEPLCIKPLSPIDALRLISRPLTYLGFQVGRHTHLVTILTNTNYYPGIIQFFGYTLVDTMTDNYGNYYGANRGNPPYTLQREQLGAIMNSAELNKSIRDKFHLSLALDQRYFMIARCIALLYFDYGLEPGASRLREGFSADEIKEWSDSLEIECLRGIPTQDFIVLLDEMRDMGILVRPVEDVPRYRLRRRSFLNIIGPDPEAVLNDIEHIEE